MKKTEAPIERETIITQRNGLVSTRDKLRLELASYDGAIQSLDLLLNPEKESQPEEEQS